MLPKAAACAALVVIVTAGAAEASGRFRLPSTLPQFLGYGNGPGYHAPMTLSVFGAPPAMRVQRVLHPPMTPWRHAHGFDHSATLIGGPAPSGLVPTNVGMPTNIDAPANVYAPTIISAPPQPTPVRAAEPRSPSEVPFPEPLPLPTR